MTTILKIQNDYSFLQTNDTKVKSKLWKCLRFREMDYFHDRRYKMGIWDGFVDFFNYETGKFLTGLLPEVLTALRVFSINYEIQDLRQKTSFLYEEIDKNFFDINKPEEKSSITLHDYQVELINKVIKHQRGIIFAPTSAGKTMVMVGIIKTLPPNTPILILQNRSTLSSQNYENLIKWGIQNVGTLWGKKVAPNLITVANVQSISKIVKLLPKFKVVIVDEVHDMMSKMPKAVYRKLKNCDVRIALSATPFKHDGKDKVHKYNVKGFFGPVLEIQSAEERILTTKELQNRGILSKSKCIFYPVHKPELPYEIYMDAIKYGIVQNNYFNELLFKLAKQQNGRTLILVDRIAHGDILNNLLPGSLWIQGKDDETTRSHVIKQLTDSHDNVIAIGMQQILNTGINFFVHNFINAAGGKADHQIIQRIGRGLRTADDKDILNYYDFVFHNNPYLLKHSKKRISILEKQGHEVVIKEDVDL